MEKKFLLNKEINETNVMKKNYIAPRITPYALLWENGVALNILSGKDTPTINSDDEVLSNKKENIIWKDNGNGGMWDGMND